MKYSFSELVVVFMTETPSLIIVIIVFEVFNVLCLNHAIYVNVNSYSQMKGRIIKSYKIIMLLHNFFHPIVIGKEPKGLPPFGTSMGRFLYQRQNKPTGLICKNHYNFSGYDH